VADDYPEASRLCGNIPHVLRADRGPFAGAYNRKRQRARYATASEIPAGAWVHCRALVVNARATCEPEFHIRIITGDRVKVELSPYDLTRGRIMYRDK